MSLDANARDPLDVFRRETTPGVGARTSPLPLDPHDADDPLAAFAVSAIPGRGKRPAQLPRDRAAVIAFAPSAAQRAVPPPRPTIQARTAHGVPVPRPDRFGRLVSPAILLAAFALGALTMWGAMVALAPASATERPIPERSPMSAPPAEAASDYGGPVADVPLLSPTASDVAPPASPRDLDRAAASIGPPAPTAVRAAPRRTPRAARAAAPRADTVVPSAAPVPDADVGAGNVSDAQRPVFRGSLGIDSSPSGALVFIDGRPVGATPVVVDELPAGSRVVRVEADGYHAWSSAIRVVANQQTTTVAHLTAASAK